MTGATRCSAAVNIYVAHECGTKSVLEPGCGLGLGLKTKFLGLGLEAFGLGLGLAVVFSGLGLGPVPCGLVGILFHH